MDPAPVAKEVHIGRVENELGVYVNPDADPHALSTVDKLVEFVGG